MPSALPVAEGNNHSCILSLFYPCILGVWVTESCLFSFKMFGFLIKTWLMQRSWRDPGLQPTPERKGAVRFSFLGSPACTLHEAGVNTVHGVSFPTCSPLFTCEGSLHLPPVTWTSVPSCWGHEPLQLHCKAWPCDMTGWWNASLIDKG